MNRAELALVSLIAVFLVIGLPTSAWCQRSGPVKEIKPTNEITEKTGVKGIEKLQRATMKLECSYIPPFSPPPMKSNQDSYLINFQNTGKVGIPARTRIKWSFYCSSVGAPALSGRYTITKIIAPKEYFHVTVPKTGKIAGCRCEVGFE